MSYILVFVAGLYIARTPFHNELVKSDNMNNLALARNITNISVSISNEPSFFAIGMKYQADKVSFHHYETMYEKYLQKYIGSNLIFLEIGLGCGMQFGPGASAYLWRTYLGPRANIHFIEYDQKCGEVWYKTHGEKLNVTMHYGNQENISFLKTVNSEQGYFDIIVDDGGHKMKQQITSLTYLLSKVRSGGVYIIEDLHTSYMPSEGGGYLLNSTTIELIKTLVDDIQTSSPQKTTGLSDKIFSFEISNKICFFTVK